MVKEIVAVLMINFLQVEVTIKESSLEAGVT